MVDEFSLKSLFIETYYEGANLSTATGFIIRKGDEYFLATNWHVVTGKNSETLEPLDEKNASKPNKLEVFFLKKIISSDQNKKTLLWDKHQIPLYKDLENPIYGPDYSDCNNLWLEHRLKNKVDVVLIPISQDFINKNNILIYYIDLDNTNPQNLSCAPAMNISILGFPLGYCAGGKLPIWVSGFIASEPNIDEPLLLVDANGEHGLSGSPVILRKEGSYTDTNGNYNVKVGFQTKFMGIFSGRYKKRINNELIKSKICKVWKPKVFEEILAHNKQ